MSNKLFGAVVLSILVVALVASPRWLALVLELGVAGGLALSLLLAASVLEIRKPL